MQKLTSPAARSRRKRIEREAIQLLDGVRLTPSRRKWAISRIREARRPTVEARRIVAQAARRAVELEVDDIGHSEVQELRARIIRRDGLLDIPPAMLLARMDRIIATFGMTKDAFAQLATLLFSEALKPALPDFLRRGEVGP